MNYIRHLTGFFDRIVQDADLNPTHISLYIGLFQYWNVNRFRNPISITRDEVMRISKIASKATYHKCMKDLHSKGYVKYEPSFNPFKGSMVILYNLSEDPQPVQKKVQPPEKILPNNEQVLNKSATGQQAGIEQALVPSKNNINNTNISNCLNLGASSKNENDNNPDFLNSKDLKEKMPDRTADVRHENSSPAFADYNAERTTASRQKSSAKKKENDAISSFANSSATNTETSLQMHSAGTYSVSGNQEFTVPSIISVRSYFVEQNFPDIEAQKFFNHYSSNGWLIGGKSPMVNWQAAAQNWMINSANFQGFQVEDRAKQLNVSNNKNYAEPL